MVEANKLSKSYPKKSALYFIAALALSACGGQEGTVRVYEKYATHCDADSKQERAGFILQCIENANPKSDEEPEDWILKCQRMAEETLCDKAVVEITEVCDRSDIFRTRCSSWAWRELNREVKAPTMAASED